MTPEQPSESPRRRKEMQLPDIHIGHAVGLLVLAFVVEGAMRLRNWVKELDA